MTSNYSRDLVQATPDERPALDKLDGVINIKNHDIPKLLDPDGREVELPESVFHLLKQLVRDLSEGRAVAIVSRSQELTTQQAADILNVSRPYLVKLLEAGAIPFSKTGTHRRIHFDDLIAYKQRRDDQRRSSLALLTQLGEEMGDYD